MVPRADSDGYSHLRLFHPHAVCHLEPCGLYGSAVYENLSVSAAATDSSLQAEVRQGCTGIALYSLAANQKLLNLCLKEELHAALQTVPRLRVILDNAVFSDREDALLNYLMQMKRCGKVELVLISSNVREMVWGIDLDFGNVILFRHNQETAMQELSKQLWGSYTHYFPVPVAGKPPAFLGFTIQSFQNWATSSEERPRVRAIDLQQQAGFFGGGGELAALQRSGSMDVFLVPAAAFLPEAQRALPEAQGA